MYAPLPDMEVSLPSKTGEADMSLVSAGQFQYLSFSLEESTGKDGRGLRKVAGVSTLVAQGLLKLEDKVAVPGQESSL